MQREETCPLCSGGHRLKDCTANKTEYKCINCITHNFHKHPAKKILFTLHEIENAPVYAQSWKRKGDTLPINMAIQLKQKRGGYNNQKPHQIKCYQVNVQHSKAATANLMKMISTNKMGNALIQEPYQYQGKLTGIRKGYRIFACGEGKRRAAIMIQDNTIDALLITQQSYKDAVLLEVNNETLSFYVSSV